MVSCVVFLAVNRQAQDLNHIETLQASEEYASCERVASLMRRGSDKLTDASRRYVVSGDKDCRDSYFYELLYGRNREEGLRLLSAAADRNEVKPYMDDAMACSRQLMNVELHAMRLVTPDSDVNSASVQEPIREYRLEPWEQRMSAGERQVRANELLFNEDYGAVKNKIYADIEEVLRVSSSLLVGRRSELEAEHINLFLYHDVALILLVVSIVLMAMCVMRRNFRAGEFFPTIMDSLPMYFSAKDASTGRYLFCNKALADVMSQRGFGDLIGRSNTEVFSNDIASGFDGTAAEVMRSDLPIVRKESTLRPYGEERSLLATRFKVVDEYGGMRLIYVASDITDMEEVNKSVQAYAESLMLLQDDEILKYPRPVLAIVRKRLRAHCCYITRYGEDGRTSIVEKGYASWNENDEVYDVRNVSDLTVKQKLIDRLERGKVCVFEGEELALIKKSYGGMNGSDELPDTSMQFCIPIYVHNKERWGNLSVVYRKSRRLNKHEEEFLIRCGDLLGTAIDRLNSYQSLQDALAKSREAEKAESRFFSTVSHDIRTPLNAIIGFSELLKRDGYVSENGGVAISGIVSSSNTLLQLISDVLDMAKMEAGRMSVKFSPLNCGELLNEIVSLFAEEANSKGIEIRVKTDGLPILDIDELRMRQIIFNILGNAVKFTEHGHIDVNLEWNESELLTFTVADTGIGIAEEDISRVMEPFVQLDEACANEGAGLGLAICKKLIGYMDGKITLESKLGEGSVFTVRVPNVHKSKEAVRKGKAVQAVPLKDLANISVLVVDDVPLNVSVLKAMLKRLGVKKVSTASNGADALQQLKSHPGEFDLVLTDLWMPELDGIGLIREIRSAEELARLPVYAITADVDAKERCSDCGFDDIIFKPLTINKLTSLLSHN